MGEIGFLGQWAGSRMQECDCSSVTAGHLGTNDCVWVSVCALHKAYRYDWDTHPSCKFNLKPPIFISRSEEAAIEKVAGRNRETLFSAVEPKLSPDSTGFLSCRLPARLNKMSSVRYGNGCHRNQWCAQSETWVRYRPAARLCSFRCFVVPLRQPASVLTLSECVTETVRALGTH